MQPDWGTGFSRRRAVLGIVAVVPLLFLWACSDEPREADISLSLMVIAQDPDTIAAQIVLRNTGSGAAISFFSCENSQGVSFFLEDNGGRTIRLYNSCIEAPCLLQKMRLEPGETLEPRFLFTRRGYLETDPCRLEVLSPGNYKAIARFMFQDESEEGSSSWQGVERQTTFELR